MSSSSEPIAFSCDHCGTPLMVAAELAGVSGPCPECQQPITAPDVDPPMAFAEPEPHFEEDERHPGDADAAIDRFEDDDAAWQVPADVMSDLGTNPDVDADPYGASAAGPGGVEEGTFAAYLAEDAEPISQLNPVAGNDGGVFEAESEWADDPGLFSDPEVDESSWKEAPGSDSPSTQSQPPREAAPAPPMTLPPPPSKGATPAGLPVSLAGGGREEARRGVAKGADRDLRHSKGKGKRKKAFAAVALVGLTGVAMLVWPHFQERFRTSASASNPRVRIESDPVAPLPGYPEGLRNEEMNERHVLEGTPPKLSNAGRASGNEVPAWSEPSVLDPARTFLRDYLTAPGWEDLVAKSLNGEALRNRMAAYYTAHPYQPENVSEIAFEHKQLLPDSQYQFYLFRVVTDSNQGSFPMTVEETAEGFRSDWVTYVEFKDMHLKAFLQTPEVGGESHFFHVILRRGFYFMDEVPDVDGKAAFEITAPLEGFEGGWAFLPKYSNYSKELEKTVKWGFTYFPIVELKWVTEPKSPDRPYVRLESIKQYNWRGHDPGSGELTQVPDA